MKKIACCFLLLFFLGCTNNSVDSSDYEPPEHVIHTNQPPSIQELRASADTISMDEVLAVECLATDPDGDSLSYFWDSYKVNNDATLADYSIDFFLNRGSFTQQGNSANWTPARLAGRYLIICLIRDIAGYEEHAIKLVDVNFANSLAVTSDKSIYLRTDTLNLTIYNNRYEKPFFLNCGLMFLTVAEKYDGEQWELVSDPNPGCIAIGSPIAVAQGDSMTFTAFMGLPWQQDVGYEPGVYRFYLLFWLDGQRDEELRLYTNEFEIIQ